MEVGKMYSVPDERLFPKLADWTRQIYDKFTTTETEALVIAQLMGHSSLNGAFYGKIALMGNYGIAERRLGKIRVTDIGKKVVYPENGKEKYDGIKTALFKIPLWERLYQEYTAKGAEIPANFWADLAKIADIPPDDAKNKADWVTKAYNTDLSYLKSAEKEMSTIGGGQMGQKLSPNLQLGQGTGRQGQDDEGTGEQIVVAKAGSYESGKMYFISPDDKVKQEVPRSAWQIDLFKTYIDGVLEHVKAQLVNEAQMVTEKEKAKKPKEL